jgi:formylglycine-generating enzyme required for sulfatase activity
MKTRYRESGHTPDRPLKMTIPYGHSDRAPVVDPKGPPAGRLRVLRGGSWNDFSADVRASARDHPVDGEDGGSHPYVKYTIGFRCAGDE